MSENRLKGFLSPVRLAVFMAGGFLCACGQGEKTSEEGLPPGFAAMDDAAKVACMMERVSPDSVARFICDASLRKREGESIDTLAIAVAYAYEHYNDSSLLLFSREFDDYSSNLPLTDKMRVYLMAGQSDSQRLGYELGLEYVDHIRESRMSVADIRREIDAFRVACADDSATYRRFVRGFKTVLRLDHGKDLPEEVYDAFILME